jgi:cellulose synthase/poly-beta-1,6-N-acetylglucosamine synthase-like glycosyltransferase
MNWSDVVGIFTVHVPLLILCAGYLLIGAISIRYAKKANDTKIGNKAYFPSISIVMPTFNEEKIIASRLDSLMKTSYPKERIEVLVVDSSNDNTPSIIEHYARRYTFIRLIHDVERRGLATALNQAFRECRGEIVVKMDSDVTLAENTLTRIISHFSDARVGAVTGKVNVANQSESSEVKYRSMHETIQKAETNIDSVFMAQTFSAYRRNLMKEYKAKEYGDETIQTIHIRRQGYKVIYDPNVNFYEDYPDDDSERLRQKIRRAEGLLRVLFENARLMFNPRYGKFGMYVFPSNFFMFIISPILLAATVVLAFLDLAFLSLATYLDITILVLLAIVVAGRKRRVISGPWTFLELQYAQLRALLNVTVLRKKDYKWTKIERVAA